MIRRPCEPRVPYIPERDYTPPDRSDPAPDQPLKPARDERGLSLNRPMWHDEARCRSDSFDPDDFFLEGKYPNGSVRYRDARDRAKSICAMCPVRQECLEWALEADVRSGIWGGMTANERRRLQYPKRSTNRDGSIYTYPEVVNE